MEPGNDTQISEFLLLGLSKEQELQPLIFGLFLSMYLTTLFGNLLIILVVSLEAHLHTPMYYFLSNLSFVDICFTSTTIPKMLQNIRTQRKVITYEGCIAQMYFFILFAVLDMFLLTVMAYDRFVAICHPLHYTVIMKSWLCGLLVLVSWVMSALNSLLQSSMVLRLSFCTELEIPHFFCEINQVVQLACSDTFLNDIVMYFAAGMLGGVSLIGILYSYSKIVSSIRGISSAQGKYKAFSTCASHLSVVSLFYCTMLGVYLSSAATHSSHSSAIASVMYTVVTPTLNPFIYSLRNKDIKRTLKTMFSSRSFFLDVETGRGAGLSSLLEQRAPPQRTLHPDAAAQVHLEGHFPKAGSSSTEQGQGSSVKSGPRSAAAGSCGSTWQPLATHSPGGKRMRQHRQRRRPSEGSPCLVQPASPPLPSCPWRLERTGTSRGRMPVTCSHPAQKVRRVTRNCDSPRNSSFAHIPK
ncbi:olfactory receptor 7A17-like [Hippopotamus amphibius kiboko]|uniref:olfactory receptor 7A17-like n=1 Tax=Hippopotamus amphibius kiboko TaxID=575201 RepID=UPI002592158B|nr:olfactory receptor 7A17-like [Hippopotamus amphibius kiboko]